MKKVLIFILLFISFYFVNAQDVNSNKEICFRDSFDVINYEINLKIGDYNSQNISGNTVLKIRPVFDNTNVVKLDLMGLSVDTIKVNGIINSHFAYLNDIISINLKNKINSTDTILITVCYQGNPKKDSYWGGFYFTPKDAFNMGVGMAAQPPNFGRVWYPCIDNFTDRATYNYNITVKNGNFAVCGGSLQNIKTHENRTITFSWILSQPIPTYLSSVAVSSYSLINITLHGFNNTEIPFQTYVYKGNEEKGKKSFENIENALKIFESKFGDYSWNRIGFVETGFSSGAMEHATNITYPSYAIDGTLNYEMLMVHEFSHSWFGNLVTCETTQDMWLNEGFASYCEAIFVENMYGNEAFKKYVRKNQFSVITQANIADNGFYGVYGINAENTYGKTVYDKGASVCNALRNYMGDDLFFSSLKMYLSDFKLKSANTFQFRDSLSSYSGIDLTDFFKFYVFEEGFNHFSVDNYSVRTENNKYYIDLKVKQKLKEADFFAENIFVDLTFVDKNWSFYTKTIQFSGEFGEEVFELNFSPDFVIIDINEKLMDCSIDCNKIIKQAGVQNFESTQFAISTDEIKDSIFVFAQNNIIEADNIDFKNYKLSKNQYWTINTITGNNTISGRFYFKSTDYENNFFIENLGSDKEILYRENKNESWQTIDFETKTGYLEVPDLKSGDYIFAVKI